MDTIRFTYVGPSGSAGALAEELRTRGFSVDYEERDLQSTVEFAQAIFTLTGPIRPRSIIAGVRTITKRFNGSYVEDLPEEDSLSVEERLALLDELKSDGTTITEEEYARERARILGEL